MAGGQFSLAKLFGVTLRESANDGSDFTNPDADYRRLFLGEDGLLHLRDSAGTVTTIGASGSVATDAIWDAAGDLVQVTGANTAAKLSLGTALQVLRVNSGATAVEWGAASGSVVVPWAIQPDGLAINLTNRAIGAANRAVYSPVTIPADCTITGFSIIMGTQSGNVCVGLYNSAGSRVATSGSVACPAVGRQNVSFTGNYAATAGRYYMGFACDNNTATFGWHQQVSSGITGPVDSLFEASAFPLPVSITSGGAIAGPPAMVLRVNGGHP
jgi:hypothetical protein